MQLRVLKKQEKQIKSQKQTLRQGRKALQQDMVELEKKKASLEVLPDILAILVAFVCHCMYSQYILQDSNNYQCLIAEVH